MKVLDWRTLPGAKWVTFPVGIASLAAVQGISRYLREFRYGVSPTRAEVLQSRTSGQQKLYVVELLFPRGDAASLLFGFNVKNQIIGVSLLSMAGD